MRPAHDAWLKQQYCQQPCLTDGFGLHGRLIRQMGLPEHMSYVKLLERLDNMLHSDVQSLESSVVDFVQALHLKLTACGYVAC